MVSLSRSIVIELYNYINIIFSKIKINPENNFIEWLTVGSTFGSNNEGCVFFSLLLVTVLWLVLSKLNNSA